MKMYSVEGEMLMQFDDPVVSPGRLAKLPCHVCVDPYNRLIASDDLGREIRIFDLESGKMANKFGRRYMALTFLYTFIIQISFGQIYSHARLHPLAIHHTGCIANSMT